MTDRPPVKDPRAARLTEAVEEALDRQRAYEDQRRTRLGAGTEAVTGPVGRAVADIVGAERMASLLDAADRAAGWTVSAQAHGHDVDDIASCEAAAVRVQTLSQGGNAATGAVAGWFGAMGLTADIAATLTLSARTVRATALCYGISGEGEDERAFRLLVLDCATASAGENRQAALDRLRQAAGMLNDPAVRIGTDRVADWIGEKIMDRVARQVGVALGSRGLGRVVPVVGGAVAATVNASFQADVARAARYAYRTRWLMGRRLLPGPAEREGMNA